MYLFHHSLCVAFAGRSLEHILLLPTPSQTAMNLLPPFFHSVMSLWFRLSQCLDAGSIMIRGPGSSLCPVCSLSVRFVYRQLSHLDHREHRCVALYRGWVLPVDWTTVWLNLRLWRFTRPICDTNWLVAHGVLPTADRLNRFGMRIDPSCHCGQAESLVHLFVDCPVAKRLHAWYQMLVRRAASRLPRPSLSEVLLGYDRSVHIPPMFPCLLGIIRHRLWIARNAFRFEQTPVVFSSILSSVRSSLRFAVRLQQRHCPRDLFVETWLAGGVLGFVSEADIIVFCAALG